MGNSGGKGSSKRSNLDTSEDFTDTFGKNELTLLKSLYEDLAQRNEQPEVDKATFLQFFAVPLILGERLFKVFDWKNTGVIDLDEFLGGLAKYAGGTTDTRMEMLFHIYDLNEEQAVNKEELRMMLFSLVAPQAGMQSEQYIPHFNPEESEEEIQPIMFQSDPNIPQMSNTQRRSGAPDVNLSMSSVQTNVEPLDVRAAITQMVDDAFEECDLDRSSKLTLEQWKLFVNKNPALMQNLEYVLLGSVWDFIHPENIGMGMSMAQADEHNMGLVDEDTGLRLQLVAEDLRHLYYCAESQVEVWLGGKPTQLNNDKAVTQISITVHNDGPYKDQKIKFCPYTGKPLEYIEETMKEKVQIENLNVTKKKKRKIFLQGYLYFRKNWKKMDRKYYVINGPFLYVFANDDTSEAFEEVNYILGFFIEPLTRTEKGPHGKMHGIKLIPPAGARSEPLTLFAASEKLRNEWINALRKAARTGKIEDVYNMKKKIGRGQFSVVHIAEHKESGEMVAVKNINKLKLDAREKEAIQNEIAICQLVSHPNVIRLKETFETQRSMYLVMPLLEGDLFSHLKEKRRLDENISKRITWRLLDALKYLHALGIVHRDLKPENILMKDPNKDPSNIVIADFGLSKFAMPHERLQLACGTVAYVAPEVLRLRGYDKSCDLWSVGIILYLCLRGRLPFDAPQKKDIIKMTLSRPANLADPYWRKISNPPKNLISKLLKKNPDNRIDLETAMTHVWFDDVREELTRRSTGKQIMLSAQTIVSPRISSMGDPGKDMAPPPSYDDLVAAAAEEEEQQANQVVEQPEV